MEPAHHDDLIQNERRQLLQLLWADIEATRGDNTGAASPTERRQFIRSMFAVIEAAMWLLKQDALEQHDNGHVAFTTSELALLAESAPALQADGTVRDAPAQVRFAPNLIFAFRAHARAYSYACVLDVGDHHWELLRRSARVRNRLMHPKSLTSVQVSDNELSDARRALRWFAKLASLASLEAAGWHALKATDEIEDKERAAEARQAVRKQFNRTRRQIADALDL